MNKYELIRKIEEFAPTNSAEPWDCVGFMVETDNVEVSKVMLCLTPVESVFKQAIEQNCDMIISHHPMFCVSCQSSFLDSNYKPKLDIYSAHTNMDKAQDGTTDTIIKTLGYDKDIVNIDNDFLRLIELPDEIMLSDLVLKLKNISPNLRYTNNFGVQKVKRIAFCAGSGADFIKDAQCFGADVLVTADLKFHTALDAEIVVFDIGHFESEILILNVFKQIIGDNIEIVFAKEKSPFLYS